MSTFAFRYYQSHQHLQNSVQERMQTPHQDLIQECRAEKHYDDIDIRHIAQALHPHLLKSTKIPSISFISSVSGIFLEAKNVPCPIKLMKALPDSLNFMVLCHWIRTCLLVAFFSGGPERRRLITNCFMVYVCIQSSDGILEQLSTRKIWCQNCEYFM